MDQYNHELWKYNTEMSIPFNQQIPIPKTLSADTKKHIILLSVHAHQLASQVVWIDLTLSLRDIKCCYVQ